MADDEEKTPNLCPECDAGKHSNCDGRSWDNDKDDYVPCECPECWKKPVDV